MNAHDPQVLSATEHLRRHLTAVLDTIDMPEPTRMEVVATLLAVGDIHLDSRPQDGTVRFEAADAAAHAAVERIVGLEAGLLQRDLVKHQALNRHAGAAEAAGADVTFEFAEEPHHAAGKQRTAEEQAALGSGVAS